MGVVLHNFFSKSSIKQSVKINFFGEAYMQNIQSFSAILIASAMFDVE